MARPGARWTRWQRNGPRSLVVTAVVCGLTSEHCLSSQQSADDVGVLADAVAWPADAWRLERLELPITPPALGSIARGVGGQAPGGLLCSAERAFGPEVDRWVKTESALACEPILQVRADLEAGLRGRLPASLGVRDLRVRVAHLRRLQLVPSPHAPAAGTYSEACRLRVAEARGDGETPEVIAGAWVADVVYHLSWDGPRPAGVRQADLAGLAQRLGLPNAVAGGHSLRVPGVAVALEVAALPANGGGPAGAPRLVERRRAKP